MAAEVATGSRFRVQLLELSIDESDERLARLDWTKAQRAEVRDASWQTGVRLHTLMLSGHRRYPLGSADPAIREKALKCFIRQSI